MKSAKARLFLVDDEEAVLNAMQIILTKQGFATETYLCGKACLENLSLNRCDLVITDMRMPGMDGMQLLSEIRKIYPLLPVLIITGYGTVPLAVRSIKAGAQDFLQKPLSKSTLLKAIKSLLDNYPFLHYSPIRRLSKSHKQILQFLMVAKSSKEIANILYRSIRTVEDHRAQILKKLNIRTIQQLFSMLPDGNRMYNPDQKR